MILKCAATRQASAGLRGRSIGLRADQSGLMKTVSRTTRGHSIVPKFAANLTMLFNELPFLDRFAAAKAAGFTGVEYLFPYDFEKAVLGELLQQYGLTQVLHNLPRPLA